MTTSRTLHGGCHCGRNLYIIQPPKDAVEVARLLFDPAPSHRASLASPLPTYLRVPLAWYHSRTLPFYPDETSSMIHRAYEHAADSSGGTARRQFCGFCGTPLTFWSEAPRTEAEYIRLALGSLNAEDLDELDEWTGDGGSDELHDEQESAPDMEQGGEDAAALKPAASALDRVLSSTGLPWFDSYVEGSRLSRRLLQQQQRIRRHDVGSAQSADGSVQVEWEVLEWTEGDDDDSAGDETMASRSGPRSSEPSPAKRARLGAEADEHLV